MVSPRVKFVLITIDELVLVPIAIALIALFAPDYVLISIVVGLIGSAIFVAGKWYIIYPALQDDFSTLYELAGMEGQVTVTVTPQTGKIKVGQEIWDARCEIGEIPKGARVKIISRESMKVKVTAIE